MVVAGGAAPHCIILHLAGLPRPSVTIVPGLPWPGHNFKQFHWRCPLRSSSSRLGSAEATVVALPDVPAPFKPFWPPGGPRLLHRASQGQGGGQPTHSLSSSLWGPTRW